MRIRPPQVVWGLLTRGNPGTVTIPQYLFNKTKQHTHTHSFTCSSSGLNFIFRGFGTNCRIPSNWDLARWQVRWWSQFHIWLIDVAFITSQELVKFLCSMCSYLIGESPIFLTTKNDNVCLLQKSFHYCLVDLNWDLYRLCGSLHGPDTFWP